MAAAAFCSLRLSLLSPPPLRFSHGALLGSSLSPMPVVSLKNNLSSSASINVSPLLLLQRSFSSLSLTLPSPHRPSTLTVHAHKGYKMKTHKATAKRFRVTGRGKIVRRQAGKQHLLAKKNSKRKLRLSKMLVVNKSDYDNVIGALPYIKVNRKAI